MVNYAKLKSFELYNYFQLSIVNLGDNDIKPHQNKTNKHTLLLSHLF